MDGLEAIRQRCAELNEISEEDYRAREERRQENQLAATLWVMISLLIALFAVGMYLTR